jgi:hypothetical protein
MCYYVITHHQQKPGSLIFKWANNVTTQTMSSETNGLIALTLLGLEATSIITKWNMKLMTFFPQFIKTT